MKYRNYNLYKKLYNFVFLIAACQKDKRDRERKEPYFKSSIFI